MKTLKGWIKVDENGKPIICYCHNVPAYVIRKTSKKPNYMEKGWKLVKVEIKEVKLTH